MSKWTEDTKEIEGDRREIRPSVFKELDRERRLNA
jgi:hypothetical protein